MFTIRLTEESVHKRRGPEANRTCRKNPQVLFGYHIRDSINVQEGEHKVRPYTSVYSEEEYLKQTSGERPGLELRAERLKWCLLETISKMTAGGIVLFTKT